MRHEPRILSRPTFPAPAAAPLKIASSSVFLSVFLAVFQTIHNFVIVLTKTKDVLHWNSKEKVHLTVGDRMRYACLAANPLLSAFAAVVAVSLYHNWLRS